MKYASDLSDLPAEFTTESFWRTFGTLEHEQLDFKVRPDSLTEVLPSMAMTDGGLVVLGVRDSREVAGCELNQKTLDAVMTAAHATGVEDVGIREVAVAGQKLTIVGVPAIRGRITTTPDGRLLRRSGGSNKPLVGDALARFVREREGRSAEDDAIPLPPDIDLALVNRALTSEGRPRASRATLLRSLVDLQVAKQEGAPVGTVITKAAALLFSRDPRTTVRGATVQLVRRAGVGPGPGPTTDRIELWGPIPGLLDQVIDNVEKLAPRVQLVVETRREVLPAYPRPALREVVLNALAHRDYGLGGATVDVTIWDDRIEIHSPGGLPGHITVDNIREEHYSRNRRLMGALKALGLVEEYGEGIDRVYSEMEMRLMEPPTIVATASSVTVTLYTRSLLKPEDQAWMNLLGHLSLTTPERRVLVVARREGQVTPRRIRALLPENTDVDDLISGAIAKGLLVRAGARGGTKYLLSDEIVLRVGGSGLEARGRQRQRLLDEIRRKGSLSAQEGAELLKESPAIVRHLLNDLDARGMVKAHGRTRARRYYDPAMAPTQT